MAARLDSVLHVTYLVFNEGYLASSGSALTRPDLSCEAVRLARLTLELLPDPEVMGLLALMLLHESRRAARTSPEDELILLEHQDRSLWNRDQIAEGISLVERALSSRRVGPYALQAAIAAVHAEAPNAAATDWRQIVGLYDVLSRVDSSPIVELNRAAAVAMRDGPAAGLALIDKVRPAVAILDRNVLAYPLQCGDGTAIARKRQLRLPPLARQACALPVPAECQRLARHCQPRAEAGIDSGGSSVHFRG